MPLKDAVPLKDRLPPPAPAMAPGLRKYPTLCLYFRVLTRTQLTERFAPRNTTITGWIDYRFRDHQVENDALQ